MYMPSLTSRTIDVKVGDSEPFSPSGHILNLSDEMLEHIISNIKAIGSLVSLGLTCAKFYNFCSLGSPMLFGLRYLDFSSRPMQAIKTTTSPLFGAARFLATGPDEKQYFSCCDGLLIVDFSKENPLFCLKPEQIPALKSMHSESLQVISCHPTKNGFILVTKFNVSTWSYNSVGEPELDPLYPLFNPEPSYRLRIISSGYVQDMLLLTIQREGERSFLKIDLKDATTIEPSSATYLQSNLHKRDSKLFNNKESLFMICDGFLTELKLSEEKLTTGKNILFHFLCANEKWIIGWAGRAPFGDYSLTVIPVGEEEVWSIPTGGVPTKNCFIQQDFFITFLHTDAFFEMIHLPTRKKYSSFLSPILAPYFKARHPWPNMLSLSINVEKGRGFLLRLIFQDRQHRFDLIDIPLKEKIDEGEGKDHVIPSFVFFPNHSSQTVSKIVTVVGTLMLLLTVIVSISLIVSHPGLIVYQGSGVILTLPATLVLSLGGPASLLVLAIGSYRWWKTHN